MEFPRFLPGPLNSAATIFNDETEKLLCFNLWSAHLEWLHACGFLRASDCKFDLPRLRGQHQVVQWLSEYIDLTGRVNAHFGLTSSDIIDNVRLIQLCCWFEAVAQPRIAAFTENLLGLSLPDSREIVGFTHWRKAEPITWSWRIRAWVLPLQNRTGKLPVFQAKHFGGATGQWRTLRRLLPRVDVIPFDWSEFGLSPPASKFPIQSSDHTCELEAMTWLASACAQLHKVCADLRFLYSHDQVRLETKSPTIGSSCMPHKVNPVLLERACSIFRYIGNRQLDLWQVAAHNGVERTLDTSWQISHVLREVTTAFERAMDGIDGTQITLLPQDPTSLQPYRSESELLLRVWEDVTTNRWETYLQQVEKAQPK